MPTRAAHVLLARGWQPLPLLAGGKRPRGADWLERRYAPAELEGAFRSANIGLLLGSPSAGLVDVDLDCPEALQLADDLLPPTGMIHGRPGAPRSHRWYVCPAIERTTQYSHLGSVLVELRSTGGQTVVPPSVHPCGEILSWDAGLDPATVGADALRLCVSRLAAACVLLRDGWEAEAAIAYARSPERGVTVPSQVSRWLGLEAQTPRSAWPECPDEEERVRDALRFVDASAYDVWNPIGRALNHWGHAAAREVWDEWSAGCEEKFSSSGQDDTWQSFGARADPITLGTLYHLATEGGWLRAEFEAGLRDRRIAEAVESVAHLPEAVLLDPGAHLEPAAVAALRILRDGAPAEFQRVFSQLPAKRALNAAMKSAEAPAEERIPQAQMLMGLFADSGAMLFHDGDEGAYSDVRVGGHRETWRVRSSGFRRWLRALYFADRSAPPGAQAFEDSVRTLEALATCDSPEHEVHVRVARTEDAVYLDLGDSDWRAVEITASGWEVLQEAPVRFRRPKSMLPLPAPARGGSLDDLRPLVNVPDDDAWTIVRGWLIGALHGEGPYLGLVLQGEQGSAKTTLAQMLRAMVDPALAPLRSPPRAEQDLAIAASNGHVVGLDNLSSLPEWLSDALCRVATGGGFGTRQLYSDAEESIFDSCRPLLLNGIAAVAVRPDLADRVATIHLPRIEAGARREEGDLWDRYAAVRPRVLGALCDAVSRALGAWRDVRMAELPRMADAAIWVTAAEGSTRFCDALRATQDGEAIRGLEGDVVSVALLQLLEERTSWRGTAAELLEALGRLGDSASPGWPRSPRAMGSRLARLAPSLRLAGVTVERRREGSGGASRTQIVLSR